MPAQSLKNFSQSPAVTDLGLGDQLTQQLQDEEDEQRKRRLQQAQAAGALGASMTTPSAASMLFGNA